jgi:predicted RNA-binding protein with PUA-like domain
MQYWILKSEPETYPVEQCAREGVATWDGVRNYQARNFLRQMEVGDLAFFYHSGKAKEIVALCSVEQSAFPDPTALDGDWSAVKIRFEKYVPQKVTLAQIKGDPKLQDILLVRNSRISVSPVPEEQFAHLCTLAGLKQV